MLHYTILIFIVSLFVLIKSSDIFVKYASKIAHKLGVSEFVIGMTIVAIGTSLPELWTNIMASIQQNSAITMGNIVGSNLANIGLVLGIGAILSPIIVKKEFIKDSWVLLGVSFLFLLISIDRRISFAEGLLLFLCFFLYMYREFKKKTQIIGKKNLEKYTHHVITKKEKIISERGLVILLFLIASLAGLYIGSNYLVDSTIILARLLKISEGVIAITAVAIGTSLPELSVTISSARKKLEGIMLGNIIGSNIVNILLVIGVSALINPIAVSLFDIYFGLPVMLFITLIFMRFLRVSWVSRVLDGVLLLLVYALFVIGLLILAPLL